jgi:hypothetical protein
MSIVGKSRCRQVAGCIQQINHGPPAAVHHVAEVPTSKNILTRKHRARDVQCIIFVGLRDNVPLLHLNNTGAWAFFEVYWSAEGMIA